MSEPGTKDSLKLLIQDLRAYVEKRVEILSFEMQEKASRLAAAVISDGAGLVLVAFGAFFALMAAGFGLGAWMESNALGFLLLSVLLAIPGFLLYKFKRNKFKLILKNRIEAFLERNLDFDQRTPGKKHDSEQINPKP